MVAVPTVAATPPAPAEPTAPLTGCEAVRAEVSKYSGWDVSIITAIAKAENRTCDPLRHNLTTSETHRDASGNVICVGSYGVIQVGCLHYREGEDRDDLATNVEVAHRAYTARQAWDSSGYNAWTMFTNGTYKQYL